MAQSATIGIASPTIDGVYGTVQQLWATIWLAKWWLDELQQIEAWICDHSMKLEKSIEKLQLEVAALDDEKKWPKETNMASFPTLILLH